MPCDSFIWSQIPSAGTVPPKGCCHSLVNYKDKYLLLFGGGSAEQISNEVFVFDLDTEKWFCVETHNSEVVNPRISHTAVVYGDKMIVYGGQAIDHPVIYGDLLELDLRTWEWTLLGSASSEPHGPGERRLHSAHVYRDRMYVVLGDPGWETSIWYLDLVEYTWHPVHLEGMKGRFSLSGHCSFVEGDYLYIFGGYQQLHHVSRVLYSNSLYRIDLLRETFEVVIPCSLLRPAPRYAASMVVHNGKVYLFGGDANQESVAQYFNDFWRIDVSSSSPCWEKVWQNSTRSEACYPSARSGHSSCLARSALYIMGGEIPGKDDIQYSRALFRYPLGLSTQLSLKENALRVLTSHTQWTLLESLPFSLREAVQRRLHSSEANQKGSGWERSNTLEEFSVVKCNRSLGDV